MEHKLAVYLEKRFSNCTERTELERVKMIYGLEIWMDNMFKLLAIIVLGMVLGIFKETMCAFCGFGILRIKAGGFHCETNKMCWLVSVFCSVGNAYIANEVVLPLSVGIALSAMCILLIGRYAPSGTLRNPINECNRGKRRRDSLLLTVSYVIVAMIGWKMAFARALLFGVVAETITILPWVNRKYRNRITESVAA